MPYCGDDGPRATELRAACRGDSGSTGRPGPKFPDRHGTAPLAAGPGKKNRRKIALDPAEAEISDSDSDLQAESSDSEAEMPPPPYETDTNGAGAE